MNYKEELPESCPPSEINPPQHDSLWRLIDSADVKHDDFDSHAKRFPERKYPDTCRARSTSLLTSLEACRAITKMPNPNVASLTHAALVSVQPTAGTWDQNKNNHVSLWLSADQNPLQLVSRVEKL